MTLLLALGISVKEIRAAFTNEELALLDASFQDLPDNPRSEIMIREFTRSILR